MGLLDSLVTTAVTSALGGNANTLTGNLVKGVVGMVAANPGGLSSIVDKFNQSGLGDVAASWIGKGENKPVSPQQIEAALGSEKVAELAEQAGIPPEKGAEVLSQVLPNIVDNLSPDGEIPEEHHIGTLSKIILGGLGVAGATMAAKAVASKFGHKNDDDAPITADASTSMADTATNPEPTSAPAAAQARTYTVISGDNLSKIAKHFYGNANDWPKIFDANRDKLSDPDRINVGQVLRIP